MVTVHGTRGHSPWKIRSTVSPWRQVPIFPENNRAHSYFWNRCASQAAKKYDKFKKNPPYFPHSRTRYAKLARWDKLVRRHSLILPRKPYRSHETLTRGDISTNNKNTCGLFSLPYQRKWCYRNMHRLHKSRFSTSFGVRFYYTRQFFKLASQTVARQRDIKIRFKYQMLNHRSNFSCKCATTRSFPYPSKLDELFTTKWKRKITRVSFLIYLSPYMFAYLTFKVSK